jgi:hypothetical protein
LLLGFSAAAALDVRERLAAVADSGLDLQHLGQQSIE